MVSQKGKDIEILIHRVGIYSHYIRIEFGIERCAMLTMKSGKWLMTEGSALPN